MSPETSVSTSLAGCLPRITPLDQSGLPLVITRNSTLPLPLVSSWHITNGKWHITNSCFALLKGMTEQKNRSASSRFLGNLSWSQDTNTRKPTHGNYRFLPHPATELRSSFHGPDLPDIRGDRHGLDHLSASPLRDRSHLLQWPCRRRTLVAVPSLLQPRRLGHRHLLHAPGQVGRHDSRPGHHLLLGRRRHPLCANAG